MFVVVSPCTDQCLHPDVTARARPSPRLLWEQAATRSTGGALALGRSTEAELWRLHTRHPLNLGELWVPRLLPQERIAPPRSCWITWMVSQEYIL